MFCPNCQTNNPDTARFCLNCGQELIHKCSSCASELLPGARFCMVCGQPVQARTPIDAYRLSRLNAVAPKSLVQKMRSATRSAENRPSDALGEKRTATVMMLDVVGSHALTEKLELETWVEMMNEAYDRIAPIIYRYEGTISYVMDDEILAFFGAPIAHEDDPLRAVQAGFEIVKQMNQYSQDVKQAHGVDFAMRVSINTGPVVISHVHEDLSYDYSGSGKTVSLASSINRAGEPMNVLLSENTYHFVSPYFDCLNLGPVEVNGWNETIQVFQVQAMRGKPGQTRGFSDLGSPMVGREHELKTLLNMCEAVRAGMGRAVIIVGEPGLGKTRLILEWHKANETEIDAGDPASQKSTMGRWVSGHCVSYGQGLAYQLVIDVLKNLIGVSETSGEPEIHQALLALVNRLFGEQMMEVYPFLGHLLSLNLEGEALLRAQISDPLALRTQYQLAVQRLFEELMKERPLVLVLEDLHWADASSIELFINLLTLVGGEPILFCLTTRPEHESHGWRLVSSARERLGSSLTEIKLHSLTEKDSRTLVANLLEIESLPKRVRDVLISKAEGNPYFVEELIRMFIDRQIIFHQEGAWIARGDISGHDIPDNLQGLLLARIDQLPTETRHALLVASVIGRNFPVRVLAHILKDSRTLNGDLSKLESTGLIEIATVEPDLEYMFHHSLVQDAANALLLKKDRKRLHQAVGEAIESLYPDRRKELAAVLGDHFKEAGLEKHALGYFFTAGEEALASSANQEAEIQYHRALELKCLSEIEIARLYTGLGESLTRQDRLDEAIQAFDKGIDIYKSLSDSDGIGRLYSKVAGLIFRTGNQPEYLRICLEGMELVKDARESLGKATLMNETASAYYFNGLSDIAQPLCRKALALAEQLGAIELQVGALVLLGILEDISLEEAMEALHRAIELAESHGLLEVAQLAHNNLGVMIWDWQVDIQSLMTHTKRRIELGKLRGVASEELAGLLVYTNFLINLGKWDEADAEMPHIAELDAKIPSSATIHLWVKALKGRLLGYQGDWETALNIRRECLAKYQEQQYLEQIENSYVNLPGLMLEYHRWGMPVDLGDVERMLQEGIQIADRNYAWGKKYIYPHMCILKARQGKLVEAREWLEKSQNIIEKLPSGWDTLFLESCAVEIAFAEQDWTKALEAIEKVALEDQRVGFRVSWAAALLFWAVILLRRGEPADLERAQSTLGEAISAFNDMKVGRYPEIGEKLLKETRNRLHAQTLNHTQMTRELKKARQVQESLLPEKPPEIPGWGLEVLLEPAHETSGDFYDFLALPNGRLGMVIADVTDKGTSAALYMALSRSLWRTFAVDHPNEPEQTLAETNRRILADTHGGLFITMVYGILDPHTGSFTYCSAGHHPALLHRVGDGSVEELGQTGIPLGVLEDSSWSQRSIEINEGDAMVLYTDGITDAQNANDEFFGLERLKQAVKKQPGGSARELCEALRAEVCAWVGEAPQFDDITLMVVVRENKSSQR